jgi:hypothetical protein
VKLNDEAREFRWMTPDQALAMPINQPTRTLLRAVMKSRGGQKAKSKYRVRQRTH